MMAHLILSRRWCFQLLYVIALAGLLAADGSAESEPTETSDAKPNAAETEKRKLSERILQNTAGVRDKLSGKDIGASTQRQQQEVIDDLQALVDLLKKSPPPPPQPNPSDSNSDSGSSPQSPDQPQDSQSQNSRQKSSSRKSRNSKSSGTGSSQNREDAEDSEDSSERQGETRESRQQAGRKRHLENDIWGHLPPSLREEMLNFYGERMLPQYENFVRKFYESLSEPDRKSQRSP